jgi:hypothetical protein
MTFEDYLKNIIEKKWNEYALKEKENQIKKEKEKEENEIEKKIEKKEENKKEGENKNGSESEEIDLI